MKKVLAILPFILSGIIVVLLFANLFVHSPNKPIDVDNDNYPAQDELGHMVDCDDNNIERHPNALDIPNDGIDQDCDDEDFKLDITIPIEQEKLHVTLYKNFTFTEQVNQQTILDNSKLIRVRGKISSASLIVQAGVTDFGYDPSRKHTVYFYIDNAAQGGHIGVKKENNLISDGDYYTTKEGNGSLDKIYALSALPISVSPNGSKELDVVKLFNKSERHYIGAFVATGIYGVLKNMTIEYTCVDDKDSCSIEVLQ